MNRLLTALLFLAVMVLSAGTGAWLAHYKNDHRHRRIAQVAEAAPAPARQTNPKTTAAAVMRRASLETPHAPSAPRPTGHPTKVVEQAPLRAPVKEATAETLPAQHPSAPIAATVAQAGPSTAGPASPSPSNGPPANVFIVVSLPSQRAFVFKDGESWDSTRVSTGKPGKRTPVGRFTILEKKLMHRSTRYDDAPMPFMERLTWGGVAMHAGRVPGYPASHGCIRLPRSFAKRLYKITNYSSVVVVTNKRVTSAKEARALG